jgi:hypothetical protein
VLLKLLLFELLIGTLKIVLLSLSIRVTWLLTWVQIIVVIIFDLIVVTFRLLVVLMLIAFDTLCIIDQPITLLSVRCLTPLYSHCYLR